MPQYPEWNDNDITLLKKIVENTAEGGGGGGGVTSIVAGSGIGISGPTGAVTITNTGVTSITGTANQVITSASTGAVTLSLPQSIDTGSSPTFSTVTLSGLTAGRIVYTGTGGLLSSSASLLFNSGTGQATATSFALGTTTPGVIGGASGAITLTAAGTNQNITLTPSGSAGRVVFSQLDTPGGLPLRIYFNGGSEVARFTANSLLLGTTTDSSNGRLQLASHTTAAGGIGFGTDVSLYRLASSTIQTNATFSALVPSSTNAALGTIVSGDTTSRFSIRGDGQHEWGSGSATRDTFLSRTAAGVLTATSTSLVLGGTITTAAPSVGSAAAWNLGTYTADVVTAQTGVVRVNIGGVSYKLLAST